MANLEDVRRIALSLPDTSGEDGFAVQNGRKARGFAWVWMQRVEPNKPRVPCPEVIAIRTASLAEKEALIAAEPEKFFTEPHYNNFPAVLVRLAKVELDELEELLIDGWRCLAPKALVKEFDAGRHRGSA
ncbi:MAG TPA: hypothetical protein VFB38_13540 [Chthonomonadaceae bacterium]|nr:hypothetical protein [Chthonomonadaceae bacterium]